MNKKTITFTINGEKRTVDVEPNDLLLDVLRNRLGVKGPKYGCGKGDCGTCTVLLNGRSVRSCIILATEVDGQKVQTVEGLSRDRLTPLQESFIERSSFQCGFCAPGIIMAATELLRKNPNPTREEVQKAISGNLCRCTGYEPIIEAILDVAKKKK